MTYPKNRNSRDADVLDRLVRYIEFRDDGCWVWTASLHEAGYGLVRIDGRLQRSHRVAYEVLVAPISPGLTVDHLCRNRACLNPDHLEPVTQRINNLRGLGVSARNAVKTHCPQNHPYTAENTYHYNGGRVCRTCACDRSAAQRARKRQAA